MDGQIANKGTRVTVNGSDRRLAEQFIYGLSDEGMISEILREASGLEDINDATGEQVLL